MQCCLFLGPDCSYILQEHTSDGTVINGVKAEWDTSKDVIMKNMMIAKFKEYHDLAIQLITTKDKTIIEANHNDLYWASGLLIWNDNFVQSK